MNIYIVGHKDDCYGYYISASTVGRAKMACQSENWECTDYIDLRACIVKKNVDLPDYHLLSEDECKRFDLYQTKNKRRLCMNREICKACRKKWFCVGFCTGFELD